ncbi:LuxR family transcriptional regulator [Sphingomonas sp. UV9]|uniref:helix-turn-helix domain-containing protein n=1 Tax=Sphingomonas sp. UV9 TaxID=1851410 RepID=UPI000FFBDE9B|nr:helix-turn-helix transcriptional regulator [Sphingomonas sp. UV9]RXD04892.1 LuxR family transcriptional regulator [Sphingomonas sp. UV9]
MRKFENHGIAAGLSERQIECLRLVAAGVTSSKVIADRLGLAPSSVDNYLSRAAQQLGVRGRDEAAAAFLSIENGVELNSVQPSVSRSSRLVGPIGLLRGRVVAASRWLLAVPPIGGGLHRFNRVEIAISILKVAALALSFFTALVLLGSGLVWLMGR